MLPTTVFLFFAPSDAFMILLVPNIKLYVSLSQHSAKVTTSRRSRVACFRGSTRSYNCSRLRYIWLLLSYGRWGRCRDGLGRNSGPTWGLKWPSARRWEVHHQCRVGRPEGERAKRTWRGMIITFWEIWGCCMNTGGSGYCRWWLSVRPFS